LASAVSCLPLLSYHFLREARKVHLLMSTSRETKLRIGAFRYLNSLPVLAGLARANGDPLPGAPSLRWGSPADCARWLATDEIDVGLIPSIEYARGAALRYLPGVAISTERQVRSVVVLSREPLERCTSIALDATSRTSVALLKILLARHFHIRPRLEVMPPDPEAMLARHDAALLIADQALVAPAQGLRVYDLAAAWHAMTGLPFVFALWAVRDEVAGRLCTADLERFRRPLSLTTEELHALAEREAPRLGLDPQDAFHYLHTNLHYRLGEREFQALEMFFRLAAEEGLVPAGVALRPVEQPGVKAHA